MRNSFSNILRLKHWLSSVVIILLVTCIAFLLKSNSYRFNPQYLVDNSIFKDKNFAVEVKEIVSPKLKLKAYLFEEHSNPIVSVSFLFKQAGAAYDDKKLQGTSEILSDMLTSGAGNYDINKFHRILEQKAIHIGFASSLDDFSGELLFIKKDISIASKLINLALTKPRFDLSELQKSIQRHETIYKRVMEQPETKLYTQSLQKLYGNHPYGRNPYGNIQHLKKITANNLRHFMRNHLTTQNLVIGISGDITSDEAGRLIDNIFHGIPNKYKGNQLADIDIDYSHPQEHIVNPSRQNIGLFMAKGPERLDSDFYPTIIAIQTLMGGTLNSRIHHKARETEGLTYGVYGSWGENDKHNYINGEYSSTPDNFSRLTDIVLNEWQSLGEKGITLTELEQVKNYMIAADALRYADMQNISATLVYMQKKLLGLDFLQKRNSYIQNIKLDDVNNAAKKYFTLDNLRLITMGDSEIEER